MKHITIGDICVYSEDEDTWDDLIRVVRKANKAYVDSLFDSRLSSRVSWIKKVKQKVRLVWPFLIS
jgi:predicted RNA-binding protein YlxR (DUF448 family)